MKGFKICHYSKVKGYSQSSLGSLVMEPNLKRLYERVWDEADYVVPPAENGAFFVTTNVVVTPNQTLGTCPEDPGELPQAICIVDDTTTLLSSKCARGIHHTKSNIHYIKSNIKLFILLSHYKITFS